jgi:CBS domain-containing protein
MAKAVTVRDYMSANLVTFAPDMDIFQAIHILITRGISGGPVIDRLGNLIGMLSEKDCLPVALTAGYHAEGGGRVDDYMHADVKTVEADTSIVDVARIFMQNGHGHYPVMQDNRLVGQISRRDLLRALDVLGKE